MSQLYHYTRPAERDRGCVWADGFETLERTVLNGGSITGTPTFSVDGEATLDGTADRIDYPGLIGIKAVSFWIYLATATEDLIQLSATHSIEVAAGTLTATGFTAPTIEIDGVATASIAEAGWHFVTCRTATAFDVDDFTVGHVASFGQFSIRGLKLWQSELTLAENAAYYDNTMWTYRDRALIDLPMQLRDHDPVNRKTINRGRLGSDGDAVFGAATAEPTKLAASRGYEFDGANDNLVVSDNPQLRFDADTDDFTLCVMVRPSPEASWRWFFEKNDGADDGYQLVALGANTIRMQLNASVITTTEAMIDGQLYTIIVPVHRDGNGEIWMNGRLAGSASLSGITMATTADLLIGNRAALDRGCNSDKLMLQVYGFALNPMQVLDLNRQMTLGVNKL